MSVAVFFDVDDTLLDNYAAFKETLLELFPRKNLSETYLKELYKEFRVHSEAIYNQYRINQTTSNENMHVRWQMIINELNAMNDSSFLEKLDDLYHVKQKQQKLPKEYINLFSFLSNQQIQFGVLTNGLADAQANKVKQLQLHNYMSPDLIFISEVIQDAKPNFSCFRKIEQLVPKAVDSFIYLGDSFKNDIEPLLNSQWCPIWINRFNNQTEKEGYIEVKNNEEAVMTIKNLIQKSTL
ncbi:HAD family hydrolase [Tetragenococcus koreensis]|uniref:HAD family hydrolase n=1 Tax=Tetragenococcus koreensis TaxID=290335 RepID=UPI000F500A86|nr:HAD family hydrolase [Tetragenococcus koreensis]AYW44838.1 haloacid dehalogenase [Tetragenococcus koreensis]GEN90409.1 haloacid dehalogenase [Tetragenococcus koreensis]